MARNYTDNDTGSWMKHNGLSGSDEGWTQVNIIEFSDGFARTVGSNIPIEEFERLYKRADEISAGPWSQLDPKSLGLDLMADDALIDDSAIVNFVDTSNAPSLNTKSSLTETTIIDHSTTFNESAEHQLIRNAIKLSKKTSDVTINVDYTIPFDLNKLTTIISTMEIDSNIIVDVMMENIKRHPEGFFIAIEKALNKMIDEPKIRESK